MAYLTADQLAERLSNDELLQLTDVDGLGVPNDDTVGNALAQASNEIDGYLAGRFALLPLAATPERIKDITAIIARYRLWSFEATDRIREDYRDAISYLKDVAAGRVQLMIDPLAKPESASVFAVKGLAPAFTAESMAAMGLL